MASMNATFQTLQYELTEILGKSKKLISDYTILYYKHPIVFAKVNSTDTTLSYSNIITDKQQ